MEKDTRLLQAEILRTRGEVDTITSDIDAINDDIVLINADLQTFDGRITAAETHTAETAAAVAAIQSDVANINTRVDTLTSLDFVSWDAIAKISAIGKAAEFFAVGDEKTITLTTGEAVTLIILGFNHDTKTAGGLAGITFGMQNLLATAYPMNNTNTNAGGWHQSVMRTATMNTLKGLLPSDLRAAIKPVNKLASAGSQLTSITTSSDSLFLLSEIEVFGSTSRSAAGEGTQYAYYRDIATTAASRIKKLSNGTGSANIWWERSPQANSSGPFCTVSDSGVAVSERASGSWGVSFGFCI